MIRTCTFAAIAIVTLSAPSGAATPAEVARLSDAMRLDEMFEIMRLEGLEYDEEGIVGAMGWRRTVSEIYDVDAMSETFRARFEEEMEDVDTAPLIGFYEGELGQEIVSLELAARQAFLDLAVEDEAGRLWSDIKRDAPERRHLLETFVDSIDLIDLNVAGALNSNLEFYKGMATNPDLGMSEEDMLSFVWREEPRIRDDTTNWVYSYGALAYKPLSDEELQRYLDVFSTQEGQELNRAMFAAFADMFDEISFKLGRATALYSLGEDL